MLSAAWDWYYGSNEEFLLANCQFGKPYDAKGGKKKRNPAKAVIRPGTLAEGVLINVFTVSRKDKQQPTILEMSAKNLKVLRHPNILRFVGCAEVESEVHLVTERAYPLAIALTEIDAHEICSGLHDTALALQFLHERASVAHNNVCIESLYVTDTGTWKLGDFEFACSFAELTKESLLLVHKESKLIPPEEKDLKKLKWPLKAEFSHCRDVYCFGLLVERFAEQIRFSTHLSTEKLQEFSDDLTRADFENRPSVKEILSLSLFKAPYISMVHFLQSVTLKTKTQKDEFFSTLVHQLEVNHIFADVVGRRFVPLLLTPIVLAEPIAISHVIPRLLTPAEDKESQGLLPPAVFARYVIPKIVELFQMRTLHVRIAIVEHFSKYVHLFEKTVLTDVVLPELLLGLGDSNNQLVQSSLHALADSVAVVGGDLIVGGDRQKLFSLGIPKFDGRALNETQSLAYEKTKFPQRKKPPPKKKGPEPPPLPATLLELALQRPRKTPKKVFVSQEVALAKQQHFASSLKSNVTQNGHNGHAAPNAFQKAPAAPKAPTGHHSKPQAPVKAKVATRKRPEPKKVEIETWASSDDQHSDNDSWPSFDEDPASAPVEVKTNVSVASSVSALLSDSADFESDSCDENNAKKNSPETPKFPSLPLSVSSSQVTPEKRRMGKLSLSGSYDENDANSPEISPETSKVSSLPLSASNGQVTPEKKRPGKLSLSGARKIKTKQPDTPSTTSAQKHSLGEEFEIVVKATPPPEQVEEPDFFADMAPKISSTSSLLSNAAAKSSLVDATRSQISKKSDPMTDSVDGRSVDSGQGSTVSAFNVVEEPYDDDDWDNEGIAWN